MARRGPGGVLDEPGPDVDDALRVRFGTGETAALDAAARAQGVSSHALVSGIIARAELAECAEDATVALLTPSTSAAGSPRPSRCAR